MRWLEHRIPPPLIGALLAAAMWQAAERGPLLPLPAALRWTLVGACVLAGVVFDLAGLLAFRAARTTINPLHPERSAALVTHGVYRLTRNPMYVGMALLLLGWALHLRAWLPLAGPVLFVLLISWLQILPEERALARRFGAAWQAYQADVPRWL